jgi:hypothetical protein
MAGINRRQFVIGSGAAALTGIFSREASAQAYINPDKIAKQLMAIPAEQWDMNALNSLNPDQRKAVGTAIGKLEATVEAELKLRMNGARDEAKGPSLQEKMEMERQSMEDAFAKKNQSAAENIAAMQEKADMDLAQAIAGGDPVAIHLAKARHRNADRAALRHEQQEPQLRLWQQQKIEAAVQAVARAEEVRDAHHDPLLAFAPESARSIPGQIRNREIDLETGKTQALNDLHAWYGRALDALGGTAPAAAPAPSAAPRP